MGVQGFGSAFSLNDFKTDSERKKPVGVQGFSVIEQYFLDKGIHTSWATLRDQLSTHQVVTVALPTESGEVLRIRKGTTPEAAHRLIFETLQIPMEVMAPVKTWTPAA